MKGLRGYFSKKKYIQEEGKEDYKKNKSWVDECNGKAVFINDIVRGTLYQSRPKWEIAK